MPFPSLVSSLFLFPLPPPPPAGRRYWTHTGEKSMNFLGKKQNGKPKYVGLHVYLPLSLAGPPKATAVEVRAGTPLRSRVCAETAGKAK